MMAASLANAFLSVAMGTIDYQITSTRDATSQSWEPNHCGTIGGASKWFEFHAENDGTVAIDTRGSTFDTVLAVYRKAGVYYLAQNEVACNADAGLGLTWSRVSFEAQRGTNYYVVVDGANPRDLTGLARLNWAMGRRPQIGTRPAYELARVGQRWRFEAGVTNAVPPPVYRWKFNGREIGGATNEWYEVASMQLTNAGSYSVSVSNALGEAEELIASLSAPLLTGERSAGSGRFQLTLAPVESAGRTLVLEASSDLIHWTPVGTQTNPFAPASFSFPANPPLQFFRARPAP